MTGPLLLMAAMLLVILIASELFTNALEHLGDRLGISEGVTGSLFAAVGTALPETMVPLLALLSGTANASVNEEIGVGAILGAPLMLSTLSTALMALAVVGGRGLQGRVAPERSGLVRDLHFFLVAFAITAAAMYVPTDAHWLRNALSLLLVLIYVAYVGITLRASERLVRQGHRTEAAEAMFFARLGLPTSWATILLQLGLGLVLLIAGAKGFIHGVEGAASQLGVSTLLPAIGILLTPWQPRIEVLTGVFVTLLAAGWLRVNTQAGGLAIWALLLNGVLYVAYLAVT